MRILPNLEDDCGCNKYYYKAGKVTRKHTCGQ